MKLITLTSNENLEGIWNKTHNFTYPLLAHITADNPTNKSTLNHSDNTHKRK